MSEVIQRWKSPTPPFFKKIGKYATYLAWVMGVVTAGVTSIMTAGIAIPAVVPIVLGAITAMSTTAAATAKLATEDQTLIDKQYSASANTGDSKQQTNGSN